MNALPPRPARVSARQAVTLLSERDPIVAGLAEVFGPVRIPKPTESHFAALVRALTQQQLSAAAAATVHRRLLEALDDEVTPERVLATPPVRLRDAGLSAAKAAALHDLATKLLDGTVTLEPRRLARQDDDAVITHLTQVRGIGTWSAQMFLLFQLRRPDVWPSGDLVVRKGYARAWRTDVPTPRQLDLLGEPFRPHRSVVAWYCWRAAREL